MIFRVWGSLEKAYVAATTAETKHVLAYCNVHSIACFTLADLFGSTPSFNLDVIAKSALATRKILDFRNPAEANASYEIKFPGPRLQCQETEGLNITSRRINTENPEALFE